MTLSVQECLQHIRSTLGGELSSDHQPISILNQAGRHLVTMHEWLWCLRPPVALDVRADISFSNGSSTSGSAVLTVSGASSYVFLEGDQVQLTGGTGVTPGYWFVNSQAGTALTLSRAIQSSGVVSNITGTIITRACRLPSDFRKLIAVVPTNGLVNSFELTDLTTLSDMRSSGFNVAVLRYYGAIAYGMNRATAGGPPAPRLELYPTASTDVTGALKLTYVAGWTDLDSDQVSVGVPDFCETLYIQLIRAFARAYDEEDAGALDQRLELIERGSVYRHARERDGEAQANLGQMQGGAAQEPGYTPNYLIPNSVGGPI